MVTRCYFCGGETARQLVRAENWWGGELALVENVPAWVCQVCGEKYYDADTVEREPRQRLLPIADSLLYVQPLFLLNPQLALVSLAVVPFLDARLVERAAGVAGERTPWPPPQGPGGAGS
jgi:YgiT-type zinc finger domain-containing protein